MVSRNWEIHREYKKIKSSLTFPNADPQTSHGRSYRCAFQIKGLYSALISYASFKRAQPRIRIFKRCWAL